MYLPNKAEHRGQLRNMAPCLGSTATIPGVKHSGYQIGLGTSADPEYHEISGVFHKAAKSGMPGDSKTIDLS